MRTQKIIEKLSVVGVVSILAALPFGAMAGEIERVSLSSSGAEANDRSSIMSQTAVSADGRYVVFYSYADNLVPGDNNGEADIFVRDTQSGTTELVNVPPPGETFSNGVRPDASISDDGRYIVFETLWYNYVYLRDRVNGTTELMSVSSTGSRVYGTDPVISGDGQYVVFASGSTNVVPNDTNGVSDIFVINVQSKAVERVSVDSSGNQANNSSFCRGISGDGRYALFDSYASNLVSGDTNGATDVFVHDRQTGVTERVSYWIDGAQFRSAMVGNDISPDGRYVTFSSWSGLGHVMLRDRLTNTSEVISVDDAGNYGNKGGDGGSISADGRYVAFSSNSTNLVSGDTNGQQDVFVRDRVNGATQRISISNSGSQGNGWSAGPSISSSGRYIAFSSYADNLVAGDSNGVSDMFLYDRQPVSLSLSPGSGKYASNQSVDIMLILENPGALPVSSITLTLDGNDILNFYNSCAITGTLVSGGSTWRCPGVNLGGLAGSGQHSMSSTFGFTDNSSITDTVQWEVMENSEP